MELRRSCGCTNEIAMGVEGEGDVRGWLGNRTRSLIDALTTVYKLTLFKAMKIPTKFVVHSLFENDYISFCEKFLNINNLFFTSLSIRSNN